MPPKMDISLPAGTKVPDHIALILDGNRRWARAKGKKPWEGHAAGYEAVKKVAQASRDLGVHTFTVWAWSTDNWERSTIEIKKIFNLFRKGIKEMEKELHREQVKFVHLGKKDRFPKDISNTLSRLEEDTSHYNRHVFNLAMDYGGRDEIVRAVKKIIEDGVTKDDINEELFSKYLDTASQPYPNVDLFIRTSGEQRTSGLLPWQMVYSEYYWECDPLPDFSPKKLREAILDYSRRRRRFGGNDEEKHLTFKPEVTAKLEIAWWRLRKVPQGKALTDFATDYLYEQYGLSKRYAKEAAVHMANFLVYGNAKEWEKAKAPLKKFYKLLKRQVKLAFEPEILTSLRIKLWQEMEGKYDTRKVGQVDEIATSLCAEEYRISSFQAAKSAHLRVLAEVERNLAEEGLGEEHWERAQEYLEMSYKALKERVA